MPTTATLVARRISAPSGEVTYKGARVVLCCAVTLTKRGPQEEAASCRMHLMAGDYPAMPFPHWTLLISPQPAYGTWVPSHEPAIHRLSACRLITFCRRRLALFSHTTHHTPQVSWRVPWRAWASRHSCTRQTLSSRTLSCSRGEACRAGRCPTQCTGGPCSRGRPTPSCPWSAPARCRRGQTWGR